MKIADILAGSKRPVVKPRCGRCGTECSPGPIVTCVACGYSWRPFIKRHA